MAISKKQLTVLAIFVVVIVGLAMVSVVGSLAGKDRQAMDNEPIRERGNGVATASLSQVATAVTIISDNVSASVKIK